MFDDDNSTLTVTLYKRPHGRTESIEMANIEPEQVQYFCSNNIPVSMEDCGPFFAIYAEQPQVDEQDEPTELTLVVKAGETCQQAMKRLQELCEEARKDGYWRPAQV